MQQSTTIPFLQALPADATNGKALEWVNRMRRIVDRWETFPEYKQFLMTPDLRHQAREQLDAVERSVRENMLVADDE